MMCIVGNGIRLFNCNSRTVDYIWNTSLRHITCSTVSTNAKCIAFATEGPMPLIHIYNYPEKTLRATLEGKTQLNYQAIAISNDGNTLAAIGCEDDEDLSIFDLQKNELKLGGHVPLPHFCKEISFNPFTDMQLCTSGNKGIYFWKITDQFESNKVDVLPGQIPNIIVENTEGRLPTKPEELVDIKTHSWTPTKDIIAASTKGELFIFDPATGNVKETIYLEDEILCNKILITTNYYVLGCSDGKIRWISMEEQHLLDGSVTLNDENAAVVSFCHTPDYQRGIATCKNGVLYSFNLQLLPPSTPSGKRKAVDQTKKMNVKVLQSYPVGSILCGSFVKLENESVIIVTGGDDGVARAWDANNYDLLHKLPLTPYKICSISVSINRPVVAIGNTNGEVWMVYCRNEDDGSTELHTIWHDRLYDTPITHLLYHPILPILTIGTYNSNKLIYVVTRPDCLGKVLGCSLLPDDHLITSIQFHFSLLVIISCYGSMFTVDLPVPGVDGADPVSIKVVPRTRLDCATFGLICVPLKPISKDIEYLTVSPNRTSIAQYTFLADWSAVPVVTTLPVEPKQPTKCIECNNNNNNNNGENNNNNCNKGISSIALPNVGVGCGETYFATGSLDGTIVLYRISDQDICESIVAIHNQSKPITSLAFSIDGMKIVSTSLDGTIMVYSLSGTLTGQVSKSIEKVQGNSQPNSLELTALEALTETYYEEENINIAENPPKLDEIIRIIDKEKIMAINQSISLKKERLNVIYNRLQDLLNENSQVTDLQRLERSEFVIDLVEYAKRKEENNKRMNELREKLEDTNYGYQLLLEKYKHEFWDSMEVHAVSLYSFKSGIAVRNFPIPQQSAEELQTLEKVKIQRQIEILALKSLNNNKREWNGLCDGFDPDSNWLINAGNIKPQKSIRDGNNNNNNNNQNNSNDKPPQENELNEGSYDEENMTIVDLLYHPFACKSIIQKRYQCILIRQYIREIKHDFNIEFDKMMSKKKDEMERILSKNARIQEIIDELRVDSEYYKPKWDPSENPEEIFKVEDKDITVEPYVSEEEKARRKKQAEEEERRRKEKENSPEERALREMMDGVIFKKKDLNTLNAMLQPEPWMVETNQNEWTDEQKQQFKAFEERKKVIEEERDQKKKMLELELRRLKTEVNDITRIYDDSLNELYSKMLASQMIIYTQQYYIARLQLSMVEVETDSVKFKEINKRLEDLLEKQTQLQMHINRFQSDLAKMDIDLSNLIENDRSLRTNFEASLQYRTKIQNQKVLHECIELFNMRKGRRRHFQPGASSVSRMSQTSASRRSSFMSGSRMSFASSRQSTRMSMMSRKSQQQDMKAVTLDENASAPQILDPFVDANKAVEKMLKERELKAKDLAPIDFKDWTVEEEAPDETLWNRLQDLRIEKIQSEEARRQAEDRCKKAKQRFSELQNELDSYDDIVQQAKNNVDTFNKAMYYNKQNIDILIQIKQGLHEIQTDNSVVIDYHDAMLVNRTVIEQVNNRILELGQARIDILTQIRDFKRKIHYLHWKKQYLEQMRTHVEESHMDIQMLRVTKALQEFMRTDPALLLQNNNAVDEKRNELAMQTLMNNYNDKVEIINQSIYKLKQQIRVKQKENKALEYQIDKLEESVKSRRDIMESRLRNAGANSLDPKIQAMQRMDTVVARRKLIDLAKDQTEEIEYLRQELDRLRQKTFPSFSQTSQWIAPDEKITY